MVDIHLFLLKEPPGIEVFRLKLLAIYDNWYIVIQDPGIERSQWLIVPLIQAHPHLELSKLFKNICQITQLRMAFSVKLAVLLRLSKHYLLPIFDSNLKGWENDFGNN